MKLAQTFQAIEETQFLKQLSSQNRLFFVGETEILQYLQEFFQNHQQVDNNYYCDLSIGNLDDIFTQETEVDKYQAIIVASFKNEAALFERVKQKAIELKIKVTPLRLFADVFINLVCKRQLLQPSSEQIIKPKVTYAIVTSPRSGSTYFCDLLESTGIAGYPTEHLRLAAQELARYCDFDYLRLLHNLLQYRTTDNGVFGTKLISHFLFEFQQTRFDFKQIFSSLDKFIFLTRRDKLAQAVSLVLAQQTDIWHIRDVANNINYQAKLKDIDINDDLLKNVEQKLDFIDHQEARLKKILADNKVEPLILVYEDIVEDAESQINQVLEFLEIEKPSHCIINVDSKIKKMPSNISQEIINIFQKRKNTVC